MIKKTLNKIILFVSMFYPTVINASGNIEYGNTGAGCPDPSNQLSTIFGCVDKGEGSLASLVKLIFSWAAGIIGSLAILGLIWASYTYIISSGNPDGIAKAKDIIWTSIASIVIIIFSYAFFKILGVI